MSKKAKAEVADESAVIITDAVLAKNNKKLSDLEQSIKAALERKQKIIMESKLYTYGQLSELYGGIEGQALLDAVTAEHTLIGKLSATPTFPIICGMQQWCVIFLKIRFTRVVLSIRSTPLFLIKIIKGISGIPMNGS